MRKTAIFIYILVSLLLSGCVSKTLPSISDGQWTLRKDYVAQAERAAWLEYDFPKAIKLQQKALKEVTDDGDLAGGKGESYGWEAKDTAVLGHYYFWQGDIGQAAKNWRESYVIQHDGAVNANAQAQKAKKVHDAVFGTINTTLKAATVVMGAYAASKTDDVYAQRDIAGLTMNTLRSMNEIPPPSLVVPTLTVASMPSDYVLRVPVTVEAPPFDNVLRLKASKSGRTSMCTATLLAPNIALTAAHCVNMLDDKFTPIPPEKLTLERETFYNRAKFTVQRYYTHQGVNAGYNFANFGDDWAILVLGDRDTNPHARYPRVLPTVPEDVLNGNSRLFLAGYSGDLDKGGFLTMHYNCGVPYNKAEMRHTFSLEGLHLECPIVNGLCKGPPKSIDTNCETSGGSSGAAVFTRDRPYTIVGVHVGGNERPGGGNVMTAVETPSQEFYPTLERLLASGGRAGTTAPSLAPDFTLKNLLKAPPKKVKK